MVAAAVDNRSYADYTFPETLDASGNTTAWVAVPNFNHHTIALTIPTATAVKVVVEGSLDGSAFFGIDPSGNGNPDNSGNIQFTQKVTYAIPIRNTPLNYIRLKLVTYSGGSTPGGITAKYRGSS